MGTRGRSTDDADEPVRSAGACPRPVLFVVIGRLPAIERGRAAHEGPRYGPIEARRTDVGSERRAARAESAGEPAHSNAVSAAPFDKRVIVHEAVLLRLVETTLGTTPGSRL